MNLRTLFISLTVLTVASASRLRKNPASQGLHPFPRVYTAVVPAPTNGTREDNANYFAAEVDLLKVIKLSGGEAKISFLVHDSKQLHRLQRLTQLQPNGVHLFQMDQNLTSNLHNQINYSDTRSRQGQRQSSYSTISDFPCYKDLQGTFDWMSDMVTRSSSIPGLSVTMTDIGDSYLKTQDPNAGYDMWAMKITGEAVDSAVPKGVFFAMSGIHAREYAPPELVSRWAELLINSYGNDADITAMLDHTEIHLVLQSNPDGRHVAETNREVMRRKNLNPIGSDGQCGESFGVDLNRNFPFRWGIDSGSSGDVCAETYRGPAPASEPEVQAILAYCESIFPEAQRKADPESQQQTPYDEESTIGVFFDVHSYGELIIWPWGHENLETGNDVDLEALASKYKHFNNYEFSGPETPGFLYPASGTTDDWAYGALGAAGMTFEVGNDFYQDCQYFEDSILDGNINALTYAAKTSKAPYSLSKGPDVTTVAARLVDGKTLSVTATASDSVWSSSNHPASTQGIREIRIYVNDHPFDSLGGQTGFVQAGESVDIDVSALAEGRHIIFVQAEDEGGYKGPVTAAYFVKQGSTGPSQTSNPVAPSAATFEPVPVAASTAVPIVSATAAPIASSTAAPIASSTAAPIASATAAPLASVTAAPIASGTAAPIASGTAAPVVPSPTAAPIASPNVAPIASPTAAPIAFPVPAPISEPVMGPSLFGPVSPPVPPVEACTDSTSVFYVIILGTVQDCDWLAVNMNRFSFLCQTSTSVSISCPLTCGLCG